MAEFMDVIRTVRRICKRSNGKCPSCIRGEFACPNNVRFDKTDGARFLEFEDVVVKWAEENPEPHYPTWGEWLLQQGVIRAGTESIHGFTYQSVNNKFFDRIDAETAEKLGLRPKEI